MSTIAPARLIVPRWSSPVRAADGTVLPTRGGQVWRWIEAYCVHGDGDWFGEPVVLRDWQRRFIERLYEYDPATGHRRYRRALLGMPKNNGKTALAAWIGAYELLGGDHVAPRVIIGAASLKQANLVFGDLKVTVTESEHLSPFVLPYDLEIQLRDAPGVAERIAAEAGTNDGARATAFIADELHEWLGRVERVYMVVDGAIAKRKDAFTLAITTAGWDRESLLWSMYAHGLDVANGKVLDDQYLFEWYEPDPELDLDDHEAWLRAIEESNPAAGDFNDVEALRYRFATMPRFEFVRYHLNTWTSSENVWIPMDAWDACAGDVDIAEGSEVWLGIDGAAKRDTTAVAMVAKGEEGSLHLQVRVFEPPGEGEVIDPSLVEGHIRDLYQRYDVRRGLFDPHLFYRSAELLREEGYELEEFPQTHDRMCPASQTLFDVVTQGRLRHGGDPTLRAHAEAAVARETGRGWRLDKMQASRHIDAVVAAAMAVYAAEDTEPEPNSATSPPRRSGDDPRGTPQLAVPRRSRRPLQDGREPPPL